MKIPTEDFTDVTLAIDGTYGNDVGGGDGGGVGMPLLKKIWIQMGIAQITIWPPSLRSNGHFVALFFIQFEKFCQIIVSTVKKSATTHPGKL